MYVCVWVTGRELSDFSRVEITADRRTVYILNQDCAYQASTAFFFLGLDYKPLTGQQRQGVVYLLEARGQIPLD